MHKRLPEDFEDLTDEEQQEIISQIEDVVASVDPAALREEIAELTKLINHARELEAREVETKLTALKDLLTKQGVFADPKMKAMFSLNVEMVSRSNQLSACERRVWP